MQKTQQKTLDGLEAYPERPKMFVLRYMRLIMESDAALQIGVSGAWFLTVIVQQEDLRRYRPVSFRNAQLEGLMGGVSRKTLDKVRETLEDGGWLYWRRGDKGKGRAAVYWVKVPPDYHEKWQEILGENSEPLCVKITHKGNIQETKEKHSPPPYIPIPKEPETPPPPPQSNPQRAVVDELIEELKNAGVEIDPDLAIERALAQGRTVEEIRSRILFYLDHKNEVSAAWLPGMLRLSLTNKSFVGKPADWGWPPSRNPEWAAKIAAKQRRKQDDSARRTVAKSQTVEAELLKKQRQLQLDFEAHLKGKSVQQIAEFVPIPAEVHNRLKQYQNWEHVRSRAPVELVINVLELVSQHYDPLRRLN